MKFFISILIQQPALVFIIAIRHLSHISRKVSGSGRIIGLWGHWAQGSCLIVISDGVRATSLPSKALRVVDHFYGPQQPSSRTARLYGKGTRKSCTAPSTGSVFQGKHRVHCGHALALFWTAKQQIALVTVNLMASKSSPKPPSSPSLPLPPPPSPSLPLPPPPHTHNPLPLHTEYTHTHTHTHTHTTRCHYTLTLHHHVSSFGDDLRDRDCKLDL